MRIMENVQLLDCTLRDGGYVNDFRFGRYAIGKIISQLTDSGIEVVECGFLEDGEYNADDSVFQTVEQIAGFLPRNRKRSIYVAMACYGEYDISQLSDYDGSSIDGIRVSFHHHEIEEAMHFCHRIKDKGYKIFIQPVGTTSYSPEQLLFLINQVNELQPYAFYFVDTLGLMHQDEVLRFYDFIHRHLAAGIRLGFHSHNNLQLSFSNCQALINQASDRTLLLDASVYGMGRAAGNLNTELITNYLNNYSEKHYEIEPVLEIVDEFILQIRENHTWGYSVPYYLAAINGCHPNYASFLSGKQTLNVRNISTILRMIEPEKRSLYDKSLAEQKYREFQSREIDDASTMEELRKVLSGKEILLVAPGASVNKHTEELKALSERCSTISIAFVPSFLRCDFVFFSNLKRYNTMDKSRLKNVNLIHTSNIHIEEAEKYIVNYSSLLNESDVIMDNAALMVLNLLAKIHPSKVYVAGMDGYVYGESNYAEDGRKHEQSKERFALLNKEISIRLAELSRKLAVQFVTPTLYTV